MKIERLSELDCRFHVRGKGESGRRWELIHPFRFLVIAPEYHAEDRAWEIPPQFYTDFASIPRALWAIMAPEELGYGPVPHDGGYYFGWDMPRAYWDDVFLAFMELDGIDERKRERAHHAVKWFASDVWNDYRKQGSALDQMGRLVARAETEQLKRGSRIAQEAIA